MLAHALPLAGDPSVFFAIASPVSSIDGSVFLAGGASWQTVGPGRRRLSQPAYTYFRAYCSQEKSNRKDRVLESDVSSGSPSHEGKKDPELNKATISRRKTISSLPVAAGAFAGAQLCGGAAIFKAGATGVTTARELEVQRAIGTAVDGLRSRLSSFTLSNGMRWVVVERHNAPIVSCHTYADVGASDEVDGLTGLAHLLEHLAFKGTTRVGTRDPVAEAAVLDRLDEVFYERQEALAKGNSALARRLSQEFEKLQAMAAELAIPNEYGALLARQGGVGLNAQTSQDSTEYFVSLPSNKLELWMALESGRFRRPVFRQLYAEKEVVREERRLRVDNAPLGRFTEAFAATAFPGTAYGRPVIGYPNDFDKIGRREVDSFFRQFYNPMSLICAVVGDVNPAEVERMAVRYFGDWQPSMAAPLPPLQAVQEWAGPPQRPADVPSTLRMSLPASPFYMEGYYRPSAASADDPALSVLSSVLSGSRTSRLYKNLVVPGKALSATSVESFPGSKRPCLLLLYGIPSGGSTTDSLAALLGEELKKVAAGGVPEDELVPVKKAAKAGLLEVFGSNRGIAKLLCAYEARTGSWEGLLQEAALLEAVSPADLQRAAAQLCRPGNRVAGHVRPRGVPLLDFPRA